MMFSITALANGTGSLGAFVGFFGLLARDGMVRLWHAEEFDDSQYADNEQCARCYYQSDALAMTPFYDEMDFICLVFCCLLGVA